MAKTKLKPKITIALVVVTTTLHSPMWECRAVTTTTIAPYRAIASLTVPGGQEFHFPHFFLKSRLSFFLYFLKLNSFSSSFWPSRWASHPPGKALAMPLAPYMYHPFTQLPGHVRILIFTYCVPVKLEHIIWWVYRGFAQRARHLYMHDCAPPPGFLFVWAV